MNTYYIKSKDGNSYIEVPNIGIFKILENTIYTKYASECYAGKIGLEEIPEWCRGEVKTLVENTIEKMGEYESQSIPANELKTLVENIPCAELTRAEAKTLFADIEKLRTGASDVVASTAVSVYSRLKKDGALVKAGTRINWNGVLKRASVDLWDTAENNPDNAPTLWEDINYRDGYRIIPDTITTGLVFGLDECGWWGDTLYRSKLTANVYTPEQYPSGWELVTE